MGHGCSSNSLGTLQSADGMEASVRKGTNGGKPESPACRCLHSRPAARRPPNPTLTPSVRDHFTTAASCSSPTVAVAFTLEVTSEQVSIRCWPPEGRGERLQSCESGFVLLLSVFLFCFLSQSSPPMLSRKSKHSLPLYASPRSCAGLSSGAGAVPPTHTLPSTLWAPTLGSQLRGGSHGQPPRAQPLGLGSCLHPPPPELDVLVTAPLLLKTTGPFLLLEVTSYNL